MDQITNFSLLKNVADPLYTTVHDLTYQQLLLPVFLLAIVITYFRMPSGSANFLDCVKRLVITALLLIGFPEIQDTLIDIANYVSHVIAGDQTDFFKEFFTVGVDAGKKSLKEGSLLNWPNLIISLLAYLCWCIVYIATYLVVAIRQFLWVTLTVLAPLLILCNMFPSTSSITRNLFKSLIELSTWQIYWRILEQILHTLGYVELTGAGDWFITMSLNIVVAFAMLSTPFVVKAIIGGGVTAMTGILQLATVGGAVGMGGKVLAGMSRAKAAGVGSYHIAQRTHQGISNYFTPKATGDPYLGGVKHTMGSRIVSKMGISRPPISTEETNAKGGTNKPTQPKKPFNPHRRGRK